MPDPLGATTDPAKTHNSCSVDKKSALGYRLPAQGGHHGAPMFDLLIRNGKVVSSEAVMEADVAVEGERVAGLLKAAAPAEARRVIDATGLYVVPGGIDAHVHFDMEFLGRSKHTFESGTIAAAFGGTPTVLDFTLDLQTLGGPLLHAVEKRREEAEGNAGIDFAFHCVVDDG